MWLLFLVDRIASLLTGCAVTTYYDDASLLHATLFLARAWCEVLLASTGFLGWFSSSFLLAYRGNSSAPTSFSTTCISVMIQSARRPQFSCPRGSESRTRKLRLHYGDFVQENFNMADKTAGKLETALRVNKTSAKVFEPRIS